METALCFSSMKIMKLLCHLASQPALQGIKKQQIGHLLAAKEGISKKLRCFKRYKLGDRGNSKRSIMSSYLSPGYSTIDLSELTIDIEYKEVLALKPVLPPASSTGHCSLHHFYKIS